MSDQKMSVDDILDEIGVASRAVKTGNPKSDMSQVNDIIEQILLEKKNSEIKQSNETLNQKEREMLEKEIQTQTKNLAKLYEKAKKEATKQQKRRIQEEIEQANLPPVQWDEPIAVLEKPIEPLETESELSMKFSSVKREQTVKLKQPIAQITQNLPKKDKLEAYAKSAHLEHIKREAMNITSHFGGAGAANEEEPSVINLSSYRKLKQSRDEKIGSFVLDSGKQAKPSEKPEQAENDTVQEKAKPTYEKMEPMGDVQLGFENEPVEGTEIPPVKQKAGYDPQIDESYVMAEEPDYSFDNPESMHRLTTLLSRKIALSRVSMIGLLVLSINAIIMMFISPVKDGMMLFGSIKVAAPLYLNINLVLLILATLFSLGIFKNTFSSLATRLPSRDILYLSSILTCLASNIVLIAFPNAILEKGVHLFTPVLIVSLFFNSYSRYIMAKKAWDNFSYINENPNELHSISFVENDSVASDLAKGTVDFEAILAKNVKIQQFTNFANNTFAPDKSDSVCSKICFIALPLSLIICASMFILTKDLFASITALNAIMVCSTTFIGGLIAAFPIKDTSKITEKFGDMSPCIEAINQFENVNTVLIDAYDLFPNGTIKLQGIKTFSGKRIDNAIVDAASVLCQSKSCLSHVFLDVIANNESLLKPVDSVIYEDLMGISAWVDNKRVLIGNRELMINHSIAVPKKDYETKYHELNQELVYIATEGELCAAFVLGITTKKGIYDAFCLLRRNGIKAVIKSVDAILTPERIATVFKCDTNSFKILPSRLHRNYLTEHDDQKKQDFLIGNNGTFLGFIFSLVVTKRLSSCINSGMIINVLTISVGLVAILGMFLFNQLAVITNLTLFGFLAFFGIIYWLNQKNTHI